MKRVLLLLILLLLIKTIYSQDLYFPKEIRKAYANGTRDYSGNPGTKYWQNKSEYRIEASVDSYNRILYGNETIKYYNNSPDTLKQIIIRLYQDFDKPGKSRDWEVNEKYLGEGVKLSRIAYNNREIEISDENINRTGTRARIIKGIRIAPGAGAEINIDWSFKIPKEFPRMGMYDSTSYMIAYWYPQISVYDDIDGWDESDHTGLVEFYNDFCDFDVKIKTDRPNMCVWATGLLKNPEDIFTEKFYKEYASARKGSGKFKVDLSKLDEKNQMTKNNGIVEWNYSADNVTDFAFAMSDHYVWEMMEVEVSGGKKVMLSTAFRQNANALKKHNVFNVAQKVLEYMSDVFPGIAYPFPSMTVFNGDGGMEFPMMVNDDDTETWNSTVYLTSHEMSHSYFPFYMGINEEHFGWMDEGWAVYMPQDFQTMMQKFTPEDEKTNNFRTDSREYNVTVYQRTAGTHNDLPLLLPSDKIKNPSYRLNAYNKAAVVYDILKDMLGNEIFMNCLHEYMNRWNGKHPIPYDFFFTFNDVSKQNLNWFWKKWFFEYGTADLAIGDVKESEGLLEVYIVNRGGMPVPVNITVTDAKNSEKSLYYSAKIWEDGKKSFIIKMEMKANPMKIILGNKYIPDINAEDNSHSF
jgi:hypothetical protein